MKTNKKIIIGLTGEICSGKGIIAKYLTDRYNASSYRFSSMLRDVLARLHLPISRKNMQLISTVIRQYFSQDIMAKIITKDVKNSKKNIIVVDGIRRMSNRLCTTLHVGVTADLKNRKKLLLRGI